MNSSFDLTNTLKQIGEWFVSELKARMNRQVGVDGSGYAPLAKSTVWEKLKKYPSVAEKRMIRTKDFMTNAFRFGSNKNSLRVFIGTEPHGRDLRATKAGLRSGKIKNIKKAHATIKSQTYGNVNMNDLARYQLEAGGAKFFPQNEKEIAGMDAFKKGMKLMEQEAYKQALNKMKLKLNTNLNLG